jgi:hypothetical protein
MDEQLAHAEHQIDDEPTLRTSALFLLAAVTVLLIGSARPFVALVLPVRVPDESSQLALLRLQYELFGATIFCGYALLYRLVDRHERRTEHQRARLGFWLMFLGFNLAFLPTSWRGPTPALLTQPAVLLSGQGGALPLTGCLTFIAGCLLCLWILTCEWHGSRAEPGEHAQ